jgi:hypothetical protein
MQGLYLQIGYCEKNRSAICEIDFMSQPSYDWIYLKMPSSFSDKYSNLTLCFKTEENSAA